jgi:formylglycine-generating enzyme required for sulfatase activity
LKAPAPDRVYGVGQDLTTDLRREATSGESLPQSRGKNRTAITVAGLVGVVLLVVVGWLVRGALKKTATAGTDQPTQAGESANQYEKPAAPAGMVYVPGGEFMMGRNDGDESERPAQQVTVKPFFIDTYEVTNEDYEKFVKANVNQKPPQGWTSGSFPAGDAHKPVTGVTWYDATKYAKWARKRLPIEEEWEFAARGTDGRTYPWGNDWVAGNANANAASAGIQDVGSYKGTSPFGAFDMVGNVWEWTASEMTAYPGGKLRKQPASDTKVLRGGSWKNTQKHATVTERFGWRASEEKSYSETGFRCVKDVAK